MSIDKSTFFSSQKLFRKWLQSHHLNKSELWVGYYKKHTGKSSITWPQSVDEGLCFGWIDGLRRSIDEQSYKIRFTPRNPRSHWSHVNIKRVGELRKMGLVTPAGLDAFSKRTEKNSGLASYEREKIVLARSYEALIKKNRKAWAYYSKLPPSTKKRCDWWIMDAKREETRVRRLGILIDHSARGELIPAMVWGSKKNDLASV